MSKSFWIYMAIAWFGWAMYYGWVGEPNAQRLTFAFIYFTMIMVAVLRVTKPNKKERKENQ